MRRFSLLSSLLCFSAACVRGAGGSSADGGLSGYDGPSITVDVDSGVTSFTLSLGPIAVPAGPFERTRCVTKRLGNTRQIHVNRIHNQLGPTSHHAIIYRTADTVEEPTPIDCKPFTETLDPTRGAPLVITQKSDELVSLPPGVAYTFEANQMVRIELHYINLTKNEMMASETTTFETIPDSEFQNEAGLLFIGDPDIRIQPMSTFTLGPVFFPLPEYLADAHFFAITGHEHQWGTNVKISVMDSDLGGATPVYDVPNWLWSEPETVYPAVPFGVPKGGGFSFTCEWYNRSGSVIHFGESAQNEMCFFWAYYYPSQGSFVCLHTDQLAGGFDLCCPGDANCALAKQYLGQ